MDDPLVCFQPGGTGHPGLARVVVADLRIDLVAIGDVRRVRDDDADVVGRQIEGTQEVAPHEGDPIADAEAVGVAGGGVQRGRRLVDGEDVTRGLAARQADGDRTAAGADVDRPAIGRVPELEGALDEAFGLGARDEHPGVHLELEVEERCAASEVLKGLARSAAFGELAKAGELGLGQGIGQCRQELGAVMTEDVAEEQRGFESCCFDAGRLEAMLSLAQRAPHGRGDDIACLGTNRGDVRGRLVGPGTGGRRVGARVVGHSRLREFRPRALA